MRADASSPSVPPSYARWSIAPRLRRQCSMGRRGGTNRIGRHSAIQVVDAIVSGTHEPGTSHYELLRAFVDDEILHRVDRELALHDYRTHVFGDSVPDRADARPHS